MTKLSWNEIQGYELGLDRGVFYPHSGSGVAWNGLISVEESPSDSNELVQHVDGLKVSHIRKTGYFEGTIEAVTVPSDFEDDILLQRRPKPFGFSYRVMNDHGYKIHLVYNVLIAPSQHLYSQRDTGTFSWDFTSLPISIPNAKRSSHFIIDSSFAYSWTMIELEDVLYGNDSHAARLPTPVEFIAIFEANAILRVTDNGDGTFTVDGPDSAIVMLDSTTFEITWPSAIPIDSDSYIISSL